MCLGDVAVFWKCFVQELRFLWEEGGSVPKMVGMSSRFCDLPAPVYGVYIFAYSYCCSIFLHTVLLSSYTSRVICTIHCVSGYVDLPRKWSRRDRKQSTMVMLGDSSVCVISRAWSDAIVVGVRAPPERRGSLCLCSGTRVWLYSIRVFVWFTDIILCERRRKPPT